MNLFTVFLNAEYSDFVGYKQEICDFLQNECPDESLRPDIT